MPLKGAGGRDLLAQFFFCLFPTTALKIVSWAGKNKSGQMDMTLNDEQKKTVSKWIAEGVKLADIQKRLETEFGLKMTYLDVRLLIDELRLTPKDPERPATPAKELPVAPTPQEPASPLSGEVSVGVDRVARPGALVSGKVTFSDGKSAEWHLDQFGRLGLVPQEAGYRPSPTDLQTFQQELQAQLQGMGM